MKNAYERYSAAIDSGTVGETFIRGLRMALHATNRRSMGYSTSRTAAKLSVQEATNLLIHIGQKEPRIDDAQTAKGWKWLGQRKVMNKLGERERSIVANFDHFTLAGFWDAGRNGIAFYIPVYKVHAKDGRSFSYYAGSWQSGRAPLSVVG